MRLEQCRPVVIGLLILMTCIFATTGYANRMLRFEKMPITANLDGLGCALEKQTTARGVKFNAHTKDCVSLTESWFTATTQEANYTYFKLLIVEVPFTPTYRVTSWIPSNFVVGTTVVFYLKTMRIGIKAALYINIQNKAGTIIGISFRILGKPSNPDTLTLNTRKGGWGRQQVSGSPFRISYTLYKLEFVVNDDKVLIKVDGSLWQSYRHRTSISNYNVITYSGSNNFIMCQQIQYVYQT